MHCLDWRHRNLLQFIRDTLWATHWFRTFYLFLDLIFHYHFQIFRYFSFFYIWLFDLSKSRRKWMELVIWRLLNLTEIWRFSLLQEWGAIILEWSTRVKYLHRLNSLWNIVTLSNRQTWLNLHCRRLVLHCLDEFIDFIKLLFFLFWNVKTWDVWQLLTWVLAIGIVITYWIQVPVSQFSFWNASLTYSAVVTHFLCFNFFV